MNKWALGREKTTFSSFPVRAENGACACVRLRVLVCVRSLRWTRGLHQTRDTPGHNRAGDAELFTVLPPPLCAHERQDSAGDM